MRLLPPSLWPRFLKRRLPTSLWGRSLLIIVLPVLVMQVAVTWAFFDMHWQTVTARLSDGLAGDISWVATAYADEPTPSNLAVIADRAQRAMSLSVALQDGATLPQETRRGTIGVVDRALGDALAARIDQPFWYDTTRYPAYVDIRVQQPQGVLRIIAPRERAVATQAHIFVLWLLIATVLLMGVAILFIRNQVRAIERLAEAAEAFGRGETQERFKPSGAKEVRAAANAFMDMRARIQRHIEQRTALLASVSHDLRTPLTRLRLELALAPAFKRQAAMRGDLDEMEHMIDEYLAFARGEAGEAAQDTA
ncbi:MAG: HAMP domain-containing protein, partial [Caulobacteraceae bacterium]